MRLSYKPALIVGALTTALVFGVSTESASSPQHSPTTTTQATVRAVRLLQVDEKAVERAYKLGEHDGATAVLTWLKGIAPTTTTTAPPQHSKTRKQAKTSLPPVLHTNGKKCGGDLPPCFVCMRESRCTYGIVSKHFGCSHFHCYGKWQFDPQTWRAVVTQHHLAIPAWPLTDWSSVTPAMEDQVAAALWNHGRGCAHWVAC